MTSYCPGTLESSKNSGLSSSSYELSQYINGAEHTEPDDAPDAGECADGAPLSLCCAAAVTPVGSCVCRDGGSSEVRDPSCGRQLRACRPAGAGHSWHVHPGELQPAGSPQSGGRSSTDPPPSSPEHNVKTEPKNKWRHKTQYTQQKMPLHPFYYYPSIFYCCLNLHAV